ncbi:MAG: response regulator [Cognaticolwellia sp.]
MRILVVDDKPAILNSLSELLTAHGYLIDTAHHGLAASEKLQNTDYDLFIIDHLMPVMNGIQLTKHVRQLENYNTNTPIIFMTTQGQNAVKLVCDTSLFNAIVDKPIDEQNLLKLINDLLSSNTRYQLL